MLGASAGGFAGQTPCLPVGRWHEADYLGGEEVPPCHTHKIKVSNLTSMWEYESRSQGQENITLVGFEFQVVTESQGQELVIMVGFESRVITQIQGQ